MPAKDPRAYRAENLFVLREQGALRARRFRARRREQRDRAAARLEDLDVLRLAKGGYEALEIGEALGLSPQAVRAALSRVAEYLAPARPFASSSVNPSRCRSLEEERYRTA